MQTNMLKAWTRDGHLGLSCSMGIGICVRLCCILQNGNIDGENDDLGKPTCYQHLAEAFQHLFHSGPMTSLAVDSSAWPLISKTLTQELLPFFPH